MKRITAAAAMPFALACLALHAPAAAQAQVLHNDKVRIEYVEPKYEQIYLRLKRRQILEELDQFLSPLRLKHDITLSIEEGGNECKSPNSYYSPDEYKLRLCYSWFDMLENEASVEYKRNPGEPFSSLSPGLMPGFTRAEVIVGGTVGVTLHELGHAVFHIQQIPRLGREEDAADQIAAFMMVQFGKPVALTTIKGTYNVWHHWQALQLRRNKGILPGHEADVHSLELQRSINFLCIAYGQDPVTFKELGDRLLPAVRKPNCASEYRQAEIAFRKTLLPDVDQALMKKVQAMKILRPEDLKF
jgi:Putative metallopeptidase